MLQRTWLLTWTTYGQWLPGDQRGFVSDLRTAEGEKVIRNAPGTPVDSDRPGLAAFSRASMKEEPVLLSREQASRLVDQFQETAAFRGWRLLACAIMANHVHLVVAVSDDPDPAFLLQSFKSYGSRALNAMSTSRENKSKKKWWTEGGSKRKIADVAGIRAAISYVGSQENPLLIWSEREQSGGEPEDRNVPGD